MANKKGRPARSTEVMFLPWRMTDVLSRTRFDISRALQSRHWEALKTAAQTCVRCPAETECERWIAKHRQGESNPVPSFCLNTPFIRSHGRRTALPPVRGAMEAHKLLEAAPFDPATIKLLLRVLEEAWARLESIIEPDRIDDTWLSLAHAIVAHAGAGEIDCETLKAAAIEAAQKHLPQARTDDPNVSERKA